jgi:thiamine biosynthesis lipoprotein ApbE
MLSLSLRSVLACAAHGLIATVALSMPLRAEEFSFYHENVLGTSLELHVHCEDREAAHQAERIALAEIDRLAEVYGHYTPTSEFGRAVRLAPGERMEVSEELMGLLQRSQQWTARSGGAFNPAVESFTQCWKRAALQGELPSDEELKHIAFRVNRQHWLLDAPSHTLTRLGQEGLSLNAIAKGTILDAAAQAMMNSSPTIDGAAVVLGGDMRTIGKTKTKIAIAHPHSDALGATPLAEIQLQDRGIATSGSSERFVLIGGKRYSHIIDPTTGTPCSETASATVIAPNAETADVLATICVVMPARQALDWLAGLPGVHGCLVLATGQVLVTEGWNEAVGPQDEAKTAASKPESPHDFLVEFEIAKPENGGRYRRPYVAVWVEDQDDYPVKTLSLFLMADPIASGTVTGRKSSFLKARGLEQPWAATAHARGRQETWFHFLVPN